MRGLLRAGRPVLGLAAIVAASAAAIGAALFTTAPAPATLATAEPAGVSPVSSRSFDDSRQAQLRVVRGAPRSVTAPLAGVLTSLGCVGGDPVRSGTVVATIDGRPVIGIATEIPLWRDLHPGDRGDDVTALQRELGRLGHPTAEDGVVGGSTLRSVEEVAAAAGAAASAHPGVIAVADFAWLPAADEAAERCSGIVGAPVSAGDELFRLPPAVVSARLTTVPPGASPGQRSARVGGVGITLAEDGSARDADALRQLAGSPEVAAAFADGADDASVPVQWVLARPIEVLAVPPSALWDVRDRHACILPEGRTAPVLVEVAGSDLGQSFVVAPALSGVDAVVTRPGTRGSCR